MLDERQETRNPRNKEEMRRQMIDGEQMKDKKHRNQETQKLGSIKKGNLETWNQENKK